MPIIRGKEDLPSGLAGKERIHLQCLRHRRCRFDPWVGKTSLKKKMVTHSSILAWRILWTEEAGRLLSTELQRVGND